MSKKYYRSGSQRGMMRKEKTSQEKKPSLFDPNKQPIQSDRQIFQIDPRLLQRFSLDDNGGGYKGL